MADTIHPSTYLTEVEQNESLIKYGKAWLRAFLTSPHIPPRNAEYTLYSGMRTLLQLSPLLTEDMIPDVLTKIFVAHRASEDAEKTPEIVTFALMHFIDKYPDITAAWATNRLQKETWIGHLFADMVALHSIGVNVATVPAALQDKDTYKRVLWPNDIPQLGAALFAVKDEPSWKPHIKHIIFKLLEDGARQRPTSYNSRNADGDNESKSCLGVVFNMLEPFWNEKVFLKSLDKVRTRFEAPHYEDIARYLKARISDTKKAPLTESFSNKLVDYCIQQLVEQLNDPSSAVLDNSRKLGVVADMLKAAERKNLSWFDAARQNYQDAIKQCAPDERVIATIIDLPAVQDILGSTIPEVWNKHMQDKYGVFGDKSIISFVNNGHNLLLLNTVSPELARDFVIEKVVENNPPNRIWGSVLECFRQKNGVGFSDELRRALADHPVIKQKVLHYFTLENDQRPDKLSVYSLDDGWSPPQHHPLIDLMHNIYPEKHDVWLDLLCHYIEYQSDFTEHGFSVVLKALTGKNNPTLEQAKALSDTLGFTLEEFLGTLCAKPQASLSQEDLSIHLMHEDGSFPV